MPVAPEPAALREAQLAFAAHIRNTGWSPCAILPDRNALSRSRIAGDIDW